MRKYLILAALALLLGACAPAAPESTPALVQTNQVEPAATVDPFQAESTPGAPGDGVRMNRRVVDDQVYSFTQLIPFDGIRPIYEPEFVRAGLAELAPDELVLGVAIDGQAKAYPITILRNREMVNDELAGVPLLVTW